MNPARTPLRLPPSGVIRGCWQLSRGHGHGWSRERALAALDAAAAAAGPLVLDCADIYTGVERLIGDWLSGRPDIAEDVVVYTKFVPDLDALSSIDRDYVRRVVFRSRDRLGVNALELVQFAWWDLSQPKWVRTAEWLAELREEGVIRNLGVTNFDPASLGALLDAGIPVASSQVQLSLLDRRPLNGLTDLCRGTGRHPSRLRRPGGRAPVRCRRRSAGLPVADQVPPDRKKRQAAARCSSGRARRWRSWLPGTGPPWRTWRWPTR